MNGETVSMLKLEKKQNAMIKSWNYILTIKIRYNLSFFRYKQKAKEYIHKSEDINKIKRKINEIGDIMHLYQIHYFTFKNIRPTSVIICQNIR